MTKPFAAIVDETGRALTSEWGEPLIAVPLPYLTTLEQAALDGEAYIADPAIGERKGYLRRAKVTLFLAADKVRAHGRAGGAS